MLDPDNRIDHAEQSFDAGKLVVRSRREGATHVIALFGDLDTASVEPLDDELTRVEATDAKAIVLDLSGLEFLDSCGLKLMLRADARTRSDGNRLQLLRGPNNVHRVFVLCGVDSRLPFVG